MKKYGFIVLALALLASLCGCSAGEGEASASPTPPQTGLVGIPTEGENITFEVSYVSNRTQSAPHPELIEVRLREGEHYVGYALVMLGLPDQNRNYGGEIIMSEGFPKVDGEYQDITEEELDAAIAAAIEEYRAKKAEERGG